MRFTSEQANQVHEVSKELDALIAAGLWNRAEYDRLRAKVKHIAPDFPDAQSFIIRAAPLEWFGITASNFEDFLPAHN